MERRNPEAAFPGINALYLNGIPGYGHSCPESLCGGYG